MPRRRVISLLSLAGVSLLHGCADSSAPPKAESHVVSRSTSGATVVAATHFESVPMSNRITDKTTNEIRRLPPVYPVAESPRIADAIQFSEHHFERLPRLGRMAAVESRPYAIDLTEHDEPHLNAPASSFVPSIVKTGTEQVDAVERTVPTKRFVATKAAKPPLPPLTQQAAAAPHGSAGWLLTGTSLIAVSQRADGMIDRGFVLAEKGAYYSAQTEFKQALRTVSQALDAHFGGSHYSEALAAGWLALEEASDFSAQSQRGPVVDVGLLVESHQTPLLKDYALHDVSPVLAMQHYFAFAQEQLVEAGGRAPVASRALHGLGKIHMVLGEKSGSAERLHGPKALAFQQAALATDPGNFLAANELGVLLARFGKLHEARSVLQHSVAVYPLPETWQNLSVVHQRLGETNLAAQSLANWQVAIQQSNNASPTQQLENQSLVQWVSPQAFIGQQPGMPPASPMPPAARHATQPVQAKQKSGFLWW